MFVFFALKSLSAVHSIGMHADFDAGKDITSPGIANKKSGGADGLRWFFGSGVPGVFFA